MKRNWIAGVTCACLLSVAGTFLFAVAPAQQGLLTLTDGTTYEGAIEERDTEVVITVKGVGVTVPRDQIKSIDYSTYEERFRKRLAALGVDDADGRVTLASEAVQRKELTLAQEAVSEALKIDPTNRKARELDSLIASQLQMPGNATPVTPPAPTSPNGPAATRPGQPQGGNLRSTFALSDADVNLIRQAELASGQKVEIQFLNDVKRKYTRQAKIDWKEFNAKSPVEQALDILSSGDPDFQESIRVRNDPPPLAIYQRQINTALVQGCATSVCHGNAGAGGFRLVTSAEGGAVAAVTNFYLLTLVSRTDGDSTASVFGGSARKMISRGNARESLLLGYMLPPEKSTIAHPTVQGYNGIVRSTEDGLYKTVERWMNEELNPLGGKFTGVTFDASGMLPATQPSTQPTR
jgi:hypothetical protein